MGRSLRASSGGMIYRVLNRANARRAFFDSAAEFAAFEEVLSEAPKEHPVPILAFCIMPNHWHLVLAPIKDGDLSRFTAWLTLTHTQRWHVHHGSRGSGHLYQGRFKSFPVEEDEHFLTVCRYVERNALRAGLVGRAEDWRWGSLWTAPSGSGTAGGAWRFASKTSFELGGMGECTSNARRGGRDAGTRRMKFLGDFVRWLLRSRNPAIVKY